MKYQLVTSTFPTDGKTNLAVIYWARQRIGMVHRRREGFAAVLNGFRPVGVFASYTMAVSALLALSGIWLGGSDE